MSILKNIKNFVTGGAADVKLSVKDAVLFTGDELQIEVEVSPTEDTIHAKRIYIIVVATERSANIKQIYSQEVEVDANVQINSGDKKSWTTTIQLPEEPASFIGKHSSLHWSVLGGIELPGVNPESKPLQLIVNQRLLQ